MAEDLTGTRLNTKLIWPPGDFSEVVPPVPIPNTEVKRLSADDTEGVTPWENMSLPGGNGSSTLDVLIKTQGW